MGVSHSFHRGGGTLAVILKKKNSDVIARWNLIRTLETSPSTCLRQIDALVLPHMKRRADTVALQASI